jgi:hypothetical protein
MRDTLQVAARELRDAAARIDTLIAGGELPDSEKVTALAGDIYLDAAAVAHKIFDAVTKIERLKKVDSR